MKQTTTTKISMLNRVNEPKKETLTEWHVLIGRNWNSNGMCELSRKVKNYGQVKWNGGNCAAGFDNAG